MGVLRKIAEAARTTWDRKMRIGQKPLSELTDQELEAELLRRRRLRALARGARPSDGSNDDIRGVAAAVHRANVRQWYSNLELPPGASAAEVKAAYERLMKRYDPAKHAGNPEKHRAALELTRRLTEAYQRLLDHLGESAT